MKIKGKRTNQIGEVILKLSLSAKSSKADWYNHIKYNVLFIRKYFRDMQDIFFSNSANSSPNPNLP